MNKDMSEQSGGARPDNAQSGAPTNEKNRLPERNRSNRNYRRHRGNRSCTHHEVSFKGVIDGYEKYTYDTFKNKGSDAFSTTTKKLAGYISRIVANAGEFLNAMNLDDLRFNPLLKPQDPDDNATRVEFKKWDFSHKEWKELTTKRSEASKAAFAIVLGQCSDSIQDRLATYQEYNVIQRRMDVIGLLRLIRTCMYAGTAAKKPKLSFIDSKHDLLTFTQERKMTNAKYLETFRNKVEVFEHLGGEPGGGEHLINAQLRINGVNPNYDTPDQYKDATSQAKEEYLAILLSVIVTLDDMLAEYPISRLLTLKVLVTHIQTR